jgi:transglutaminase-like putative cysteine protease
MGRAAKENAASMTSPASSSGPRCMSIGALLRLRGPSLTRTNGHRQAPRVHGRRRPSDAARRLGMFAVALAVHLCVHVLGRAPAAVGATRAETPEERLVAAQLDLQRARGVAGYVALRRIWDAWGDADPRKVEEALVLAAEDSARPEPLRAYARALSAYARVRRGDRTSAEATFRELGFVTSWMVVGPFDNEGKSGFDHEFEPDLQPGAPIVPGQAYSGKERPVRWRLSPDVFRYGWIDFGSMLRPEMNVCAFATTFVEGGPRAKPITLWVGARGAVRVLYNGQVAVEDEAYREFDVDRLSATVRLEPGINRITVKACGDDAPPLFALRLADEHGRSDATLKGVAEIERSQRAETTVSTALAGKKPLPRHPAALEGPISIIGRIGKSVTTRASELELAARYLVLTAGDDEATHQARDLATRAAGLGKDIGRYLLAAQLAEDRNGARGFLDQASQLVSEPDARVLLARAEHLRSGPNPREAFELYDQVLDLDPDSLDALQGRVDLYNAAGLRRTALDLLERANERRPHSVLLANMVASQRLALGFSTSAAEAEDRYAALRADDTAYHSSRMELALVRRNAADTEHFLSRLVSAERDSPWSYRLAARVHRALGQEKRAEMDLEIARGIAPEDVGILQALADFRGRAGRRDDQLALLRRVLELQPQAVDVRRHVEHIQPPEQAADEKYAMPARDFLMKRLAPADGHPKRTLRDLTVSTVYENGLSSEFRQVVFQPLTDAAAAIARQYAFQYQADRQRVDLRGAKVYRADGTIDEAIESGEGAADDPTISMYTSSRTFYVQFPRLEPGDVVELKYRIDDVTPRNEFADYYGAIVYMQSDEPIASAEYVLVTPKSRKLEIDAKVPGLVQTISVKDDQRTYRFVAENVPALEPEPNMPAWSELLGFVHVSTYQSWDALGRWYWGLVKDQLDLDEETRRLAREISKDRTTDLEKVKAVYEWVIKNTRYVALEFGIYGFKPRRCVQTVNRGWGDCKDKATVIVTLLRELGIPANLVIVRTGLRGDFRSKLASLAPFDHAIAYVPSLDLYLDGTAEYTGASELPVMDREALGLLILDGNAKLVRLPGVDSKDHVVSRDITVELKKNGTAEVDIGFGVRGYAAPGYRARYEAKATLKDRLSADLGNEFPGLQIKADGIETGDLENVDQPVSIRVRGAVPQFARPEGSELSLPVTVAADLTSTYASQSKRKQDVRIVGFSSRTERTRVRLPAGAQVVAGPPDAQASSRFGSYAVQTTRDGKDVVVESRLSLDVTRVPPADYAAFRKFCQEVDQAMSHRLLVRP